MCALQARGIGVSVLDPFEILTKWSLLNVTQRHTFCLGYLQYVETKRTWHYNTKYNTKEILKVLKVSHKYF